jgi:hypothetical protein
MSIDKEILSHVVGWFVLVIWYSGRGFMMSFFKVKSHRIRYTLLLSIVLGIVVSMVYIIFLHYIPTHWRLLGENMLEIIISEIILIILFMIGIEGGRRLRSYIDNKKYHQEKSTNQV